MQPAPSSTPFSISFTAGTNNTSAASSYTFTSQSIGTADSTRIVAVGMYYTTPSTSVTVSSVTIGGSAATQATSAAAGNTTGASFSDIWYLAVPAGTTATIVINLSGNAARCGIYVYAIKGTGTAFSQANGTATVLNSTSSTVSVTTPTGGGAIGVVNVHNGEASITGSNLSSDGLQTPTGTTSAQGGNNTSLSGTQSYGFTWPSTGLSALSVASFSP